MTLAAKDTIQASTLKDRVAEMEPLSKPAPEAKAPKRAKPTRFSQALGERIIRQIRLGATLEALCKEPAFPDLLTVYDWMHDKTLKLGDAPFSKRYQAACQDRTLTWNDQAMTAFDDLQLRGDRTDFTVIKLAADRANMLLKAAKEQRMQMTAIIKQGGHDQPTVVIRTYSPEAEVLFASPDKQAVSEAKDHRGTKK